MVESVNFFNRDPNLHLRDARHAHQFYTENSHRFSPKVKFLYHVVFNLGSSVSNSSTEKYRKEIGVLAKNCDLPQFRANVDTRKQYNRNKNFQTSINYEEVKVVFHDDNFGATNKMLEEYYRYYYNDGNKNKGLPGDYSDFLTTDLYYSLESNIPRYGYDSRFASENLEPFFKNIIIYQLSRQQWNSFTLINPLVTAWGHDTLDYSSGGETLENTMSIAYEGVIYNYGSVEEGGEPSGFASSETRYDYEFSPLAASGESTDVGGIEQSAADINQGLGETNISQSLSDTVGSPQSSQSVVTGTQTAQGGLQSLDVPLPDDDEDQTVVPVEESDFKILDNDAITNAFIDDETLLEASIQRELLLRDPQDPIDYYSLSEEEQTQYREDFLINVYTDPIYKIIASQVIQGIS